MEPDPSMFRVVHESDERFHSFVAPGIRRKIQLYKETILIEERFVYLFCVIDVVDSKVFAKRQAVEEGMRGSRVLDMMAAVFSKYQHAKLILEGGCLCETVEWHLHGDQ